MSEPASDRQPVLQVQVKSPGALAERARDRLATT